MASGIFVFHFKYL